MEAVVNVVGDNEGVVVACQVDELLSPLEGHGFARRVGEVRDGIDNVIVGFAPGAIGF